MPFLPRGTQFSRSPDGVTYTGLTLAKSINFDVKSDFEDSTNMDTPTNYKQWTPTMIDGGSVKVDLFFDNTDALQTGLWTDLANQTDLYWKAQLPSARGKFTFQGYVESVSQPFEVEKLAMITASFKITGALALTPNV